MTLCETEIRARLARRADRVTAPTDPRSDYDLNPGVRAKPGRLLKPAAVLVPIVIHCDGPTILLTKRTAHLSDHAGQISFPGGRIEPSDADADAAALRETHEEVGLEPDRVRIVGRLSPYITVTGYTITPVVGLVTPPFTLTPDPFEVADTFEVPLAFILDPTNHERHSRETEFGRRHFYVLPYQDRYIWGATAGMLVNLAQMLADDDETPFS